MADSSHKRHRILVDTELQLGMSLKLMGWLYSYVVAFVLASNASSIWAVVTLTEADPGYAQAVERMRWFAESTMLPLALTFVCVVARFVMFTHRIAGPVHRIKSVLKELAGRKFPASPVALRDRDYFKDVAAEMNKVVEMLREDAARQRRMNGETTAAAREVLTAIDEGRLEKPEVLALAKLALGRAERLDRHLACVEPGASAPPAATEPAGETVVSA